MRQSRIPGNALSNRPRLSHAYICNNIIILDQRISRDGKLGEARIGTVLNSKQLGNLQLGNPTKPYAPCSHLALLLGSLLLLAATLLAATLHIRLETQAGCVFGNLRRPHRLELEPKENAWPPRYPDVSRPIKSHGG